MVAMIVTLHPPYFDGLTNFIQERVLSQKSPNLLLFLVELLFLGLSMMFLLSGVRSNREKNGITLVNTAGQIRISLGSIESIVLNVTKRITGIKETKAVIRKHGDRVSIMVKVVLFSDQIIPPLLQEIQEKVKKNVEDLTGISVLEVSASVENVYSGYKGRVE